MIAREADMADIVLVLAIEEVVIDLGVGERADRKGRHELARRAGHHRRHRRAALLEAADQVERLVGRDTAPDDQEDALGRKR